MKNIFTLALNMLPSSVAMTFIITIFGVSSCSKDEIAPLQLLKFDLVILDKNGMKTNKLKDGEDFFIGFEVSSYSEDTVFVSHEDGKRLYQQLYEQHDFLSVYRKESETGTLQPVFIGKPYDPDVEINFPAINLPGYFLCVPPFGRQYVFHGASWSDNPINRALPLGSYCSFFVDTISIEGIEITIDTALEFEVD